jgi:hypothetical protein
LARILLGLRKERLADALTAVLGQDQEVIEVSERGGRLRRFLESASAENACETDHPAVDLGHEEFPPEFASPFEDLVEVRIGHLLACWKPRIEGALEVLQLDSARAECRSIALEVGFADSHRRRLEGNSATYWRQRRSVSRD